MAELYTRRASASLAKESTVGTPVTPSTYFELNEESIAVDYPHVASQAVAGNRAMKLRPVRDKIPAPEGSININVEANTFGHFLNGMFGGLTTGRYIPFSGLSGTFQVGETITGGTSTETATVAYVGADYLLVTSPSGDFTDAETITGGTSSATATLTSYDSSVYGHSKAIPSEIGVSYTLQFNYVDSAVRYYGVRFTSLDALSSSDNIITADVGIMAQGVFRNTKCSAATAGSSVAVTVDQTKGLITGDTVKVFRPSTGAFIDLGGVGTKTTTVTVTSATVATLATVTDNILAGDILVLGPQTSPSYSLSNEFTWIGGSQISTGDLIGSVSAQKIEEYSIVVEAQFEARHSANGSDFEDMYPCEVLQKGFDVSGEFKTLYRDESFMRALVQNAQQALRFQTDGAQIGSTGINNLLRVDLPDVRLNAYDTNITVDELVEQEIPFSAYYDDTEGHLAEVLVVNNVTSY